MNLTEVDYSQARKRRPKRGEGRGGPSARRGSNPSLFGNFHPFSRPFHSQFPSSPSASNAARIRALQEAQSCTKISPSSQSSNGSKKTVDWKKNSESELEGRDRVTEQMRERERGDCQRRSRSSSSRRAAATQCIERASEGVRWHIVFFFAEERERRRIVAKKGVE